MRRGDVRAGVACLITLMVGLTACGSGGEPGPVSSAPVPTTRPTAGASRTDGAAPTSRSSPGSTSPRPGAEATTPSGQAPTCALVSAAAIGAAFGTRVTGSSVGTTPTGRPQCRFTLSGSASGGQVTVTSQSALGPTAFEAARRSARGTAVSGLGLGAFLSDGPATLRVRTAQDVLAVSASIGAPGTGDRSASALRAALVAVARTAIGGR